LSIALALMTMIAVGVVFWMWGPTKEVPKSTDFAPPIAQK